MPSRRRTIQLLQAVPLFSACTNKELARIADLGELVSAPPGQTLTREGEPGGEFFVIQEGSADVTVDGRRRARLGPGDFFGEMALLDQGPRSATVVATAPMVLFVLGAREFGRLIDEVPFVGKKILRGLALRLRSIEKAPTYVWSRF